jgi:hypothetical protein
VKILCVMLALLSVGAVSGAQEQLPSLKIGQVTVWLGMPKSALQGKFPDAQIFKLSQHLGVQDDAIWMIGTDPLHEVGSVEFTDGGVVKFASRSWLVRGSDAVEALLGAIDSFTQEGLSTCVISHYTDSNPSLRSEGARIQCGARRLHVYRAKSEASKKLPGGYEETIAEEIGEW